MTQRQKRYWRAWYKVSNYKAILDAIKGPSFNIDVSGFKPNYVEGITTYLENKAHEMYVSLKSLGAIKAANGVKDSQGLSNLDIDNLITIAREEILALRELPNTDIMEDDATAGGDNDD